MIKAIENGGYNEKLVRDGIYLNQYSFSCAKLAVGAVIQGVNDIYSGKVVNGFCVVRPPGHHATYNKSQGFCIFNNIAIGAKCILNTFGDQKIFILDLDAHHGNGTQDSFYNDEQVFYMSLHHFPCYPGTGKNTEIGEGKGRGTTCNIPLHTGADDLAYLPAIENIVVPYMHEFAPNIILVSCGFDFHKDDPLGGLRVTTKGFEKIMHTLMITANRVCFGNILFCLEGGYNPDVVNECGMVVLDKLKEFSKYK